MNDPHHNMNQYEHEFSISRISKPTNRHSPTGANEVHHQSESNTRRDIRTLHLKNIKMSSSRGFNFDPLVQLLVVAIFASIVGGHTGDKNAQTIEQQQQIVTVDRNGNTIANVSSFGDLVAIGAISLLNPSTDQEDQLAAKQLSPSPRFNQQTGRLVDSIATSATQTQTTPQNNKLDYIVEFMRQNKLTKFCDLITSQSKEIKSLTNRLNEMSQFTLFVPTNEALMLMKPQFEQLISEKNSHEQIKFLLEHLTGELVIPKLDQSVQRELIASTRWSSSRSGSILSGRRDLVTPSTAMPSTINIPSLAGSLMRITTAPLTSGSNSSSSTAILELIVNGANVISGHSHALQEPNNTNLTYAIVHLIDRPLYPAANVTLIGKVTQLAPTFSRYLSLASDFNLMEAIGSGDRLSTLFLPTEQSLLSLPSKTIQQLETNSTYLLKFLESHIVEGLHYSIQLAREKFSSQLSSFSRYPLIFERKNIQSRTLVLVNTIPIVDPDIMAINGVLHLIARPIGISENECNCDNKTLELSSETLGGLTSLTLDQMTGGNELEREESQLSAARASVAASTTKLRTSRSDSNLVERNNRDFYRPLAAPSNLLLAGQSSRLQTEPLIDNDNRRQDTNQELMGSQQLEQLNRLLTAAAANHSSNNQATPELLFEAERYSKVLNATSRKQLREQQEQLTAKLVANEPKGDANLKFTYDRPSMTTRPTVLVDSALNSTNQENSNSRRLTYPPLIDSTNITSSKVASTNWFNSKESSDQQATATNLRNDKLMIKFKPEDARDPNTGKWPAARLTSPSLVGRNQDVIYDIMAPKSSDRRPISSSLSPIDGSKKTSPSPSHFGGCAFYDADCKRLVSKLVRLPPTGGQKSQLSGLVSSLDKQTKSRANLTSQVNIKQHSEQHLDSTFGETTESPLLSTRPLSNSQKSTGILLDRPRVSPLSQPLPPYNDELAASVTTKGHSALLLSSYGSAQEDITRIPPQIHRPHAHGFTGGLSRDHPTANIKSVDFAQALNSNKSLVRPPSAQIMFVPVKLLQDMSLNNSMHLSSIHPNHFGSVTEINRQNSKQFSVTAPGGRFNSASRLTNFTTFENPPVEDAPNGPNNFAHHFGSKGFFNQATNDKLRSSRMKLNLTNESFHQIDQQQRMNLQSPRKVVQIQPTPAGIWPQSGQYEDFVGDISITSAKLTSPIQNTKLLANSSAGGLATLASNQSPSAVNNVIRSAPLIEEPTTGSFNESPASSAADFFQNRTIAEIMEDSGLRIDGQQVTFSRLKECLKDADLLSLVTQLGSSVTIFMPTDLAFQRLVQQQAIAHQRERQTSQTISARLLDPSRRSLIPLIAKMKPNSPTTDQLGRLTFDPIDSLTASNAADRLTLDCSTGQVRQLLLDHLSARLVAPKQLLRDTTLTSLSGRQLLLSSVPSKKIVVVDGQPVIAATRAKNGMVYVVNKFLNITNQMPNVVDLMETQANLTTFLSYLKFSGLTDQLKREAGPITVLAPTNEAFEQLSSSARQLINSDPSALMDVLKGHVVEGAQFGKLISMRNSLKTLNPNQNIEAKVIKPNLYQLDNQVTAMRLIGTAGNGVVNSIDKLIVSGSLKVPIISSRPIGDSNSSSLELDSSLIRGTSSDGGLNLPSISRQPTRFENSVAGSRLTQPPNSFLFSNDNSNTNSLLDSEWSTGNSNFEVATRAPLSRLTNTTSFTDLSPTTRFRGNSVVNVTKNMQLIEKLANLMKANKFVNLLNRSNLSSNLKPDMNYVILVPTDQAIDKLPKQIVDMLDKDTNRLSDLINYHVLDTTFEYINTIPDGQTLNTLNEKDILFNWHRNNTVLTASGAVVLGGIQEDNIALLIVDRVLYPTPGDILSIISKSPILSNFTALVRQTGLEQQLSLAGPYTLFAPSDFAFNQLDKRHLEFLQRNKETARRFLLRHLSQPSIFTSSIALSNSTSDITNQLKDSPFRSSKFATPTMVISNSLGEDLTLRQRNDYFSVNEVNFSYADVAATNGVVHVIDGLL